MMSLVEQRNAVEIDKNLKPSVTTKISSSDNPDDIIFEMTYNPELVQDVEAITRTNAFDKIRNAMYDVVRAVEEFNYAQKRHEDGEY